MSTSNLPESMHRLHNPTNVAPSPDSSKDKLAVYFRDLLGYLKAEKLSKLFIFSRKGLYRLKITPSKLHITLNVRSETYRYTINFKKNIAEGPFGVLGDADLAFLMSKFHLIKIDIQNGGADIKIK